MRSLDIVKPKSLALSTISMVSPSIITGESSLCDLEKEIRSSLHFSLFSFSLFRCDQATISSTNNWALLTLSLLMTSDAVVSSTYFQRKALMTSN